MSFNKNLFLLILLVLFLGFGCVSASDIDDVNVTSVIDEFPIELTDDMNSINEDNFEDSDVLQVSSQEVIQSEEDVIVVNDWNELQYYCSQTDKDYTLKLKENTNFYPSSAYDVNQQIKVKNNVKIIGSEGSHIGNSSSSYMENSSTIRFRYIPIVVEDNVKVGITFNNVTFKWIYMNAGYDIEDCIFIKMGGKKENVFKNCKFYDNTIMHGHASIVYLKKGSATLDNCSFVNCTTEYGTVSIYDPASVKSTNMIVRNCYFENNYASTEPGCINNCGSLTVINSIFFKNRSFWWAGAIHTHGGGTTTIYDSNFTDNVAGWNGGALYTYGTLKIYNTIFIGNNCTTDNGGGAIGSCKHISVPKIYIEGCLFEKNSNNCWGADALSDGPGRGGAISLMDEGILEVRNTIFIANSASIGTAICAIEAGIYGSPDVILINNSFINHTRKGDVLYIRVANTTVNVSDNYYYGNSIEFANLTLTKLSEGREQATFEIATTLSHPSYYDENILDKTLYDVFINDKYVKTVNSTVFSIDFGDLDICNVYVIPTISNRKSNEVTATSTREYVFVSKSRGDDNNNGISRNVPVNSIKRALELAGNCQNIILLDGDYSEENILINYGVTIKGEGNATLTGPTSFVSNSNLTLKNLKINNLNTNCFIKQNSNNLLISNCILTNNNALLVQNNAFTTIVNSILLNNTQVIQGNNANLDYNWWGSSLPNLNINKYATLNITSNLDALENNQKANVKAVFYLNDGNKYTKLPDINLDVTTVNGVVSQNTTNIDSEVVYTLTAFSDGALTVSYNNFSVSKTFEFLKSNPSIELASEDMMFGENVTVTVTTPSDAEGNLTVSVGNQSQTKEIQAPKSIFTFENLKADAYTITLTYTGDKKYQSKELTSTVNVNRYESTTQLNLSAVNVGGDVIITITTIDSSTGNVTLSVNSNTQTLTLTNSKANYTIKNIKRGDYLIRAVYNGDDKYLTSSDSKFIEVDNLNATMNINADDITYGETAIIKVTLNDAATGDVIVTIDGVANQSKLTKGKAEVTFTNLEAGSNKKINVFYSGDDTYFNLTKSGTFNIAKSNLEFTISSGDIKIGQYAEIIITVPQKTSGTFTINNDVINIPLSGEISYIIPNLEIGNYTYTATYDGNNYYTVSKTTSFAVSEYPIPQVQNEGFNTENTHKSQYETVTNGNIAFTIPFNETLSGDLIVDSLGNIYAPTQSEIYAFNQTSRLWYFTSTAAAGDLSGVAISRDVIIAPKSGDTLYFINQTSGERWGESNIYQGSSFFAPVVDDATLYIVSEYQTTSEDYKLTIVPYKLWEKGGDPTLITIGNTQPLCSPTLNENIIVVVSDNRLRIIDAKSLQTLSIKSGSYMPVRPIIGEGNIVYVLLSDSIVAYNGNGMQVWKTKVTSGVGNILVLDNEQGLYHVNSRGVLYKYDLIDGSPSKFSSLKVTSGILIDANNNLYFGSNNMFYALDSEGNILWRSDLASKIIGNPVMDSSGLIYVPTESGVTALTYAPLKDVDLKIQVDDIVKGQTATVTVTWNSEATGTITCNVNGEEITASADDGKITKTIFGLDIGYYDVEASYDGDMRFQSTTATKTFVVRSTDDVANNIQFDGNRTFSFSLNNAKGNLTVKVNDKTYSKGLVNGQASITVDNLAPGEYEAIAAYSGDSIYSSASRTFTVSVPKFNVTLNEQITTEHIVSTVSVTFPSDATGNLTLSIGTKKYSEKVTNGKATIIVDDIPAGNYTATLAYSGDNNYNGASKTVSINPTKIPVTLDDSNVFVKSGSEPEISIKLDSNATGRFVVNVDNEEYSADISEVIVISDLEPGNYTGTVTYNGDGRYEKASYTIHIEVPRIIIKLTDSNVIVNGNVISIKLNADTTGNLTIIVNGKKFSEDLERGTASLEITSFYPGEYSAFVVYSGDSKYVSANKTVLFTAPKLTSSLDNLTVTSNSVSVDFANDATGTLTVNVNGKDYTANVIEGKANISITDLNPGNYTALVTYSGDNNYVNASKTITLEVPKIILEFNETTLSLIKQDNNVEFIVNLPADATGDIIVSVNDKDYTKTLTKGQAVIDVNDLPVGNYEVLVNYTGDNKYASIVKTVRFTVSVIEVTLDDSNLIVDNLTVSVKLNSDAKGNLTVIVDDKEFKEALIDGSASIDITGLSPGTYTATVVYSGDEKYSIADKTITLTVPKITSNLDNLTVTSNSVSVDFANDATGTLTVNVNGRDFKAKVVDGISQVNITGLTPGNYTATVTYSGDNNYTNASRTVILEVPKIIITLDDVIVDAKSDSTKVIVNLADDATGNVTVKINDNEYSADVIGGISEVNIAGLAPGKYNATVTYSGDNNYTNASRTVSFEVPKITLEFNESTLSFVKEDNNIKITVSLAADAIGDVIVSVNDKDYTKTLINGQTIIEVNNLAKGNYEVLVNYTGDYKYTSIAKTIRFSISMINVTLNDSTLIVDNLTVSIKLNSDAEGNLTVIVDDKEFKQALIDGSASVNITGLSPGTYAVTVVYSGDDKYSIANKTITLTVDKITSGLDNLVVKSDSVSVDFGNDATGTLTVNVNGRDYTAKVIGGVSEVNLAGLSPGNYTALVTYGGDNNYTNASRTVSLEVPKIIINLDDISVDASYDLTQINVNLPADATGNVTLKINDKEYFADVIDGASNINITDLSPGKYNATVTYSGDNNYADASAIIDFEIPKVTLEFNETTLSFTKQGNDVKFTVELPADATGDVIVSVNDNEYIKTLSDGKAIVEVDNLATGNYEVLVNYTGDNKYSSIQKTVRFTVSVMEVVLDDTNLIVENLTVTIKLNSNAEGNLSVIVDNKEFKEALIDGSASVDVTGLSPGTYRATVVYSGDGKYSIADKTITLTVPKITSNLDNLIVKSNVSVPSVSIDFENDATGTLTVNVDGRDFQAKIVDGISEVNIAGLDPGNYQATVTYSGDNNYTDASTIIDLEVPKVKTGLDNNTLSIDSNSNVSSFAIELPEDATGTLTVIINNKTYSKDLVNGKASVDIDDLTPGKYNATVIYSGDVKYDSIARSTSIHVPKVETVLDDNTLSVDSNSSTYSISLPDDATGTLTVTVDGTGYTSQLVNGKATVNIPELSEGTHNITVTYSGDSKYEAITKSSVVNVNKTDITNNTGDNGTAIDNSTTAKSDIELIVSAADVNVGEDAVIQVTSSEDSIKLTVLVNNKQYTLGDDGTVTISNLTVGKYNVIVRFAGDYRFNPASNSTTFNVLKVSVPVTDETITLPDSNSTSYSVSLPSDATGTLTVTVDGKKYTENLVNGKATVNIPELDEGTHNITVTYSGDSKYEAITKSGIVNVKKTDITNTTGDNSTVIDNTTNTTADNGTAIDNSTNTTGDNGTAIDNTTNTTVEKVDSSLVVSVSDVNVGDDAIVNVKASFESGKVSVNVNGKDYQLIISNGEASTSISDLAVGNYTVLARFAGDDKLNPASNSTSFNVLKVNVPVTDETVTVPSGDSTTYGISLPSDATGTLTVTVDGVNYTETLVNGKATVKIPELTEGSHNITVTYSGNAKYSPITKSSVVVKEHVSVVKLTGSNLNMLYTSGKYFKVRLTADGEPLAGQTVKITINGKTYSKTTNKDGYASIKISLAPKTYTVKAAYANLTITKKVTVKSIIIAKNINAKKSAKTVKIKVTLKKVNKKYLKNKKVTLKFNKKTFKAKTNKKGVATFTIKNSVYKKLKTNKKYTYQVIYAKDKVKKTIKFKK